MMSDPVKRGDIIFIKEGQIDFHGDWAQRDRHFAVVTKSEGWCRGRFFFRYYHTKSKSNFYDVWSPNIMERIG